MKHFKRRECALCGRKSTMRFVHARLATGLATVPHRKVRLCMIDCRHCGKGVMAVGASKEAAKEEAVKRWNTQQARNLLAMDLLAMERFLRKIFAGGDSDG